MLSLFSVLELFFLRYLDAFVSSTVRRGLILHSALSGRLLQEYERVCETARRSSVAVFKYSAVVRNREEMMERGTIVAGNEQQAREKLERLDLIDVRLKRIAGISGLFKSLTADIR